MLEPTDIQNYDCKQESDIRWIKTKPINVRFRQFSSESKNELCYGNKIQIQLIQYNKEAKHSLKNKKWFDYKQHSELTILAKVFYVPLVEEKVNIMETSYYW